MPLVIFQEQPTDTSCGLACAGMLAGVKVEILRRRLPSVRSESRRLRRNMDEKTNVTELRALVAPYKIVIGRGRPGLPTDANPALVAVDFAVGHRSKWHWIVVAYGRAFDPARKRPLPLAEYVASLKGPRFAWHPIEEVGEMAKRKATKRNPQDATRVNVRASKGRDEKLGERIGALAQRVCVLERQFEELRGGVVKRIDKLIASISMLQKAKISMLQKAKRGKARGPRMASRTRT